MGTESKRGTPSPGNFTPGICVVCGWHGICGVVCAKRGCAGRYFYDKDLNIVRAKARVRVSKAQRRLFERIRVWARGHHIYQEVIFPWSIGPRCSGYRFDIVIPSMNLLVEYDSIIHFKYNPHFYRTRTDFMEAKFRDQIKNKMATHAGWNLIRVKEKDPGGSLDVRRWIEIHI